MLYTRRSNKSHEPKNMQNVFLRGVAEFALNQLSPVLVVAVIFAIGFMLVGIPMQLRNGAVARDVWGTVAGVSFSLLYLIVVFGTTRGA